MLVSIFFRWGPGKTKNLSMLEKLSMAEKSICVTKNSEKKV
jgi:hypothetical protein